MVLYSFVEHIAELTESLNSSVNCYIHVGLVANILGLSTNYKVFGCLIVNNLH